MAELVLVLAVLGGVPVGLAARRHYLARPLPATIDWPPTWAEICAERGTDEVPEHRARVEILSEWREQEHATEVKRHRHNVHCPCCGRFARAVPGMPGVSDCVVHGKAVRATPTPLRRAA